MATCVHQRSPILQPGQTSATCSCMLHVQCFHLHKPRLLIHVLAPNCLGAGRLEHA